MAAPEKDVVLGAWLDSVLLVLEKLLDTVEASSDTTSQEHLVCQDLFLERQQRFTELTGRWASFVDASDKTPTGSTDPDQKEEKPAGSTPPIGPRKRGRSPPPMNWAQSDTSVEPKLTTSTCGSSNPAHWSNWRSKNSNSSLVSESSSHSQELPGTRQSSHGTVGAPSHQLVQSNERGSNRACLQFDTLNEDTEPPDAYSDSQAHPRQEDKRRHIRNVSWATCVAAVDAEEEAGGASWSSCVLAARPETPHSMASSLARASSKYSCNGPSEQWDSVDGVEGENSEEESDSDDDSNTFEVPNHQNSMSRKKPLFEQQATRWLKKHLLPAESGRLSRGRLLSWVPSPGQARGALTLARSKSSHSLVKTRQYCMKFREWILYLVRSMEIMATVYTLVFTPLVVSFGSCELWRSFSAPEVLCELALIANVAMPFAIGLPESETNEWLTSPRAVFMVYVRRWLAIDVLAAVPWHMLWLISGQVWNTRMYSMLRLLLFPKLVSGFVFCDTDSYIFGSSALSSLHPNLLRVVKLIFLFFLVVHLVACGYYGVASLNQDAYASEWALYAKDRGSLWVEWTRAYYWALCGVLGENLGPDSYEETTYSSAVVGLGVLLNSCIVGSIASLLGSLDDRAARQKSKLDAINAFMHENGVTHDLRKQVREYYKYLYNSVVSQSRGGMFDELSSSLRLKVELCIHKRFIKKCHIFEACSAECVVALVTVISRNPAILVPMEVVFKKGDAGDAMYFVAKGQIVLYDPGATADETMLDVEEIAELEGKETECGARMMAKAEATDFFGERALLMDHNRRAASAVARTFAELLRLPRKDFEHVLHEFPAFKRKLRKQSDRRYSRCIHSDSSSRYSPSPSTTPSSIDYLRRVSLSRAFHGIPGMATHGIRWSGSSSQGDRSSRQRNSVSSFFGSGGRNSVVPASARQEMSPVRETQNEESVVPAPPPAGDARVDGTISELLS